MDQRYNKENEIGYLSVRQGSVDLSRTGKIRNDANIRLGTTEFDWTTQKLRKSSCSLSVQFQADLFSFLFLYRWKICPVELFEMARSRKDSSANFCQILGPPHNEPAAGLALQQSRL